MYNTFVQLIHDESSNLKFQKWQSSNLWHSMTIIKFEISKMLSLELKLELTSKYYFFIFHVLSQFYVKHPARGTRKTRVFKTFQIPSKVSAKSFRPPAGAPTFTLKKTAKINFFIWKLLNLFNTCLLYWLRSFMQSFSDEHDI